MTSILLASALGQTDSSGVIAFVSNRTGFYEIYLLDVGTGRTQKLVNGSGDAIPLDEFRPLWSPDGRRIAFTGNVLNTDSRLSSAYNREIYVVDATGNHLTNVTNDSADYEFLSDWSPDAEQLVFLSNRNRAFGSLGTRDFTEVFIMNRDGSGIHQMGDIALLYDAPQWSPDGMRMVFAGPGHLKYSDSMTETDGDFEIYVMSADGSNLHPVTDNDLEDGLPIWSPDGSQIAFMSPWVGEVGIYVINSDGSGLYQLASGYIGEDLNGSTSLVWSPDGHYLAVVFYPDGIPDLYLIDIINGGVRNLTDHAGYDRDPTWSPDSTRIAFTSYHNGIRDIYVMNIDGGNVRNLTNDSAFDYSPTWWPGFR